MSFCFMFRSTDSSLLAAALAPFHKALSLEDGAPHGWGLGYFQAGQPLLRKQPRGPEGRLDFTEQARNLRANLLVGHRRGRPLGTQATENTHPFRFRHWVFCHCGSIDGFDDTRSELSGAIPDFIRRNIRGTTDSEFLFHLFLAFLNDTGKLDDPRLSGEVAARAMASALTYLDRLLRDRGFSPSDHCCMATNGEVMVATHRGIPLSVTRHTSYLNVGRGPSGKPLSYPHLKTVLLVGGAAPQDPGWETVEQDHVVTVDADLNIENSTPLDV